MIGAVPRSISMDDFFLSIPFRASIESGLNFPVAPCDFFCERICFLINLFFLFFID